MQESPLERWRDELRSHFELTLLGEGLALADRFHFYVLACPTPKITDEALVILRDEVAAQRGAPVELVRLDPYVAQDDLSRPIAYETLIEALLEKLVHPVAYAPNTILLADASRALPKDDEAWGRLFSRMNERRNVIAERLTVPLVLCLPLRLEQVFAQAAPDFWAIQSLTAKVDVPSPPEVEPVIAITGGMESVSQEGRFQRASFGEPRKASEAELTWQQAQREVDPSQRAADEKAAAELRQALAGRSNPGWTARLADVEERLAEMDRASGDLEGAARAAAESVRLTRELIEALPKRTEQRLALVHRLREMARIARERGEEREAIGSSEEAVSLARELLSTAPIGDRYDRLGDLAAALLEAAQAQFAFGHFPEAIRLAEEAHSLFERLSGVEAEEQAEVARRVLQRAGAAFGDRGRAPGGTLRWRCFVLGETADTDAEETLAIHLAPLEESGAIDLWHPGRIRAGDDVDDVWRATIDRADLVIVLLSAALLESEHLAPFLERVFQRERAGLTRILPVIVRPCEWQASPFGSHAALPRDGQAIFALSPPMQDLAWAEVTREVAALLRPRGFVDLSRLPVTGRMLFGREKELARLDSAWASPQQRVLSIVAWGGIGKTALVNHWLARMAEDGYRGADQVFGWSFYSQGTKDSAASASAFVDVLLRKLGDPEPNAGSEWDKGERLAQLVAARRTLLVLDGLEPLQSAGGANEGRVQDPAMHSLLRRLTTLEWAGLCLVTTRVRVTDIASWASTTAPVVELDSLPEEAGVALLREAGVGGSDEELRAAVREYRGHALALTLLGSYLVEVAGGDVRCRKELGPLTGEERQGAHARHVLASYDRHLPALEKACLRLMGLFDRPADGKSILSLLAAPAIAGLTDTPLIGAAGARRKALARLVRQRLLEVPPGDDPDAMDAHPLVREYFGEALKAEKPDAWKAAHGRLFEHLKETTKEFPETVQEMTPLYAAVVHGCKAGRAQEALDDVYWERIQRGKEAFNSTKLGAFAGALTALAAYFDPPWERLTPSVREGDQGFLLNDAGFALRAVGRLEEAFGPLNLAMVLARSRKNWQGAAACAGNISDLLLRIGDVAGAERLAREAIECADRSGDVLKRLFARARTANTLLQRGQLGEAQTLFEEAEVLHHHFSLSGPYLYSLQGYMYCDLLLSLGRAEEVQTRSKETLRIAEDNHWLLPIGLDNLSLGKAALALGDLPAAASALSNAVAGLRRAGQQDFLPLGLLARANYYLATGNLPACAADLTEAHDLATRSGMRLFEADACLGLTRLALARGDFPTARECLARARQLIGECGYDRRLPELSALDATLRQPQAD